MEPWTAFADAKPETAMDSSPPSRFDVFLSHNSRDKPVVEQIAVRLQQAGLRPWLDKWALAPGGRWQDELAAGLRACAACAVCIGAHGVGDWVREEVGVALDRAAKDPAFRLFLVLLPGLAALPDHSDVPAFLFTRTWVDLRDGLDAEGAFDRLVAAISGRPSGAPARADGTTVAAPPSVALRTGGQHQITLPVPPTPLVGRGREIAAARSRLLDDGARLLTLTGPGGVGKTRLALAVAAEVAAAFPDGTAFVSLAAARDTQQVAAAIAAALGVREAGGTSLTDALKAYLGEKRLLLVLDNFEQALEAAPLVADLLAACPELRVLVTSRSLLRLSGEQRLPAPPLPLPDPERLPAVAQLEQYDAVALFVQRARAVQPDFALTDANARAVAEICARLDGLPLAIELAAARVRLLPPPALLQRLSSGLAVLTGGARDLPERQRTLRGAIAWSYDLLTPAEQTLFARLGVFVGGCALEAAEAVCNARSDLEIDLLEGAESLVDKSLVRQEETVEGEARLVMLETLREFALEQLGERGEADELRRAHAGYYRSLAEEAEPELRGPDQRGWLQRLEREHDNLRAALRWMQETGATEDGLRLAGALGAFWASHGHFSEGRSWLEGFLDRGGKAPVLTRAKALNAAGRLAWYQGDHVDAQASLEQTLALRPALSDKPVIAFALDWLGLVADGQGDYRGAVPRYEEALKLQREAGDEAGIASSLNNLGIAVYDQGDYERAAALFQQAADLRKKLGDQQGIALSLLNLGMVAYEQGAWDRAVALYEEALAVQRQLGNTQRVAILQGNLGLVAQAQGDYGRATDLYAEALATCRALGDRSGAARCLHNMAEVKALRGEHGSALALYRQALALRQKLSDKRGAAIDLVGLAEVMLPLGRPELATRLLAAAAALCEASGASLPSSSRATADRTRAAAQSALGEQAFAAAWAEGKAMSMEAAIATALDQHLPV